MYMGFNVTKGDHIIELRYETPLLKIGATISIVSSLGVLISYVCYRRREKCQKEILNYDKEKELWNDI